MKKCPFCHADIEDNARFCVFCMSSLQEKQKFENKDNNKKWPYLIAALLLLILIFGMCILFLNPTDSNVSLDASSIHNSLPEYNETLSSNDSLNTPVINPSKSEESGNENSIIPPESSSSVSSNNSSDSSQSSAIVNSSSDITSTQPQPDKNNSSADSEIQSTTETPTPATYIYRDATASDCYTEGNIPAQPIENVIVITGIKSAASNGIYTIPETIDGKKVGGIMASAFCDPAISATVKKVVVPASVKTIWQKAFYDCYNLTDIYLCGKTIDIFENSFADFSKRNAKLTIHCSNDCKTFGFYYYKNIAQNYDAVYDEWDGDAIQ